MRRILTLIALLSLVLACRSVDIQMRDYKPDQPENSLRINAYRDAALIQDCADRTTSLRIRQPRGIYSAAIDSTLKTGDYVPIIILGFFLFLPFDLISLNGPAPALVSTTYTCNNAAHTTPKEPVRPEEARKPIETVETFTPIASVHQSNSRMITIVHPGHVLRTGETLYVDDANGQRIAITVIRVFHTKSECTATQDVRIQPGARVYRATRTPIDREGQDR